MAVVTTNLGVITAYGDAVAAGYTGTKAEWQALMANYATVGQQATQDAQTASTAASTATTAAQTATTKASEASASATAAEQAAASIGTPDTTLTQSGKAADAKATGDKISEIKEDLAQLDSSVNGETSQNFVEGKNITTDGSLVDETGCCVSEFVPITWTGYGTYYCNDSTKLTYSIAFYDSSKAFIQKFQNPPNLNSVEYRAINHETQVTQGTAAYVRFSFKSGTVGKVMNAGRTENYWVAESTSSGGIVSDIGDLADLETANKDSLVGAINEVIESMPSLPDKITPKDTDFFHISKNLINPSLCVDGEFVNQTNGNFQTLSGQYRTGYIEIEPSTEYVVRRKDSSFGVNFRYAFYKADKSYISGAVGALPDMLLTSPANAKYIAVSNTYNMSTAMIAPYVSGDKSYEAYGNDYVEPKYIVDGSADDIILNIPSKVYALVGYETNIYFENITEKWNDFTWDVTCTKGMQLERGYRITPTASDVGTYTLTIRASIDTDIYKEVSTTLIVTSASAGSGETVSVIILGDSTTNNGIAVEKLHANLDSDVMSVITLGTRGTAPNNHEGRSGWSWDTYFTKESVTYTDGRGTVYNPFYNPSTQTFDASYYFANSGISKPDVFIVNMGINDVFGFATDVSYEAGVGSILQRAETAVQSILDATTTTKVCVCLTIPPNHSQDAFGKAYACGQTRNRCKRNNTLWVNALIEQFKDREDERIYIIPINACLDTVNNMGMETLPVNARNIDITYQSPISNGGVHPVDSGYWQIADVYTAFLKAQA